MSKNELYEIIYEADTRKGKAFDIGLITLIIISIISVTLESVEYLDRNFHLLFEIIEWTITILFAIEYALRIYIIDRPYKYIFSFYGIIDLLSILPAFLGLFFIKTDSLALIRALRLLRIFRILKLSNFLFESKLLLHSLRRSAAKITVFSMAVIVIVVIFGSLMYVVESKESGFTNIPQSIYWAIVTITTVGYGDIAPVTPIGKFLASIIMLTGYAIIAVPTGIITAELTFNKNKKVTTQVCPSCLEEGHDHNAQFCKLCGTELNPHENLKKGGK